MCLHVKDNNKRKTAKKDIKVFKHIELGYDDILVTPYMFSKLEFNVLVESKLDIPLDNKIDRGIHTFKTLRECIKNADDWNGIVITAIIPKGSIYYEGLSDLRYKSFTSNAIIYNRKMKYNSSANWDKDVNMLILNQ